jgi:hypothetical protein
MEERRGDGIFAFASMIERITNDIETVNEEFVRDCGHV